MQALFFDNKLELIEMPEPEAREGELMVRILVSAICNTDLEIIKGYMGFRGILGHEFVGEVVTPGHILSGKRVTGEINCSCGSCYLCLSGRRTHCRSRTVMGIAGHQGAFAGFVALPAGNLHPVPDSLSSDSAVFTEPLAAALEIFEQINIRPGDTVFIFGAGKLGLLVSLVCRLRGFSCLTLDPDPMKVGFAKGLGIDACLLSELGENRMAEVCIDCTGDPGGLQTAMSHLWPRGILVLKTTVANPALPDLNSIVINEFTILGSRCGPFVPALNLLEKKLVDPLPLISARYSFGNIKEAFDHASRQGVHKIIIDHSG